MKKQYYDGFYSDSILGRKKNWHLLKCINKKVFHYHDDKLIEMEYLGYGSYIYKCERCNKTYNLTEGSQDTEGYGSYISLD